eukprot:PITA_26324
MLINGAASSIFSPERGLRQGYPLSPLFFLLAADGISLMIQDAKRQGTLKGIEVVVNFWVTHLLFVDDILLFSNESLEDCRTLKKILDLFLKATGLCINERKSTLTCVGMPRELVRRVELVLNFEIKSMEDAFKYLGFFLKPDNYRIKDWKWILVKIESKLKHWSFKWLSKEGRLVLIKSVLMAILVYWASLTWVPKGILSSIDKLCSRFLWAGSKTKKVTPWIAWDKVARPKEWGGWGIKIIDCFSKSLAAKLSWRLISSENLWTSVSKRKYIDSLTTLDWIRLPLGRDPWIGCTEIFSLSQGLVSALKDRGLYTLNQVDDPRASSIWSQGWIQGRYLLLEEEWLEEWDHFRRDLLNSSVRLSDSPDELRWVFAQNGLYSPKMGYKWMMTQKGWENLEWWVKPLWKLKGPAKSRLFFWSVLLQKVPMWDFLQKRGRIGPGWCPLCKDSVESAQHLFLFCPFNTSLWAKTLRLLKIPFRWEGQGLLEAWQKWWNEATNIRERAIPLLVTWGPWLARNQVIFKDSVFPIGRLAAEGVAIYESIPVPLDPPSTRAVRQEFIRYSMSWAYFDSASDINGRCGAGLIIHLSEVKVVKASVGLGQGSNNFAELKALHFLLCWLIFRNVRDVQIFGDSMNAVKWFNGTHQCRKFNLLPLLREVLRL